MPQGFPMSGSGIDGRISRTEMFMRIAETVALRSTCKRAQVGAIVVVNDRPISMGYNGAPSGLPHCLEVGCLMHNGHCIRTIHAEINAITFAARTGIPIEGGILYCTHAPCLECSKAITNAGIRAVVYKINYGDGEGLKLLSKAGVDILCFG